MCNRVGSFIHALVWAVVWACMSAMLARPALACGPLQLVFHPYPGVYEVASNGEERGLDVDVVRELSRRSGCTINGRPAAAARAWPALVAGEVDLAAAVMYRPEREADVDYLGLVRTRLMLLVRREPAITTPADFLTRPSLRLGVVKAAPLSPTIQSWVDLLRAQGRVSESADMVSLLKAHAGGRVDALLIYPLALHSQSQDWLAQHQLLDGWPDEGVAGGMAASRVSVSAADRLRLREALQSMIRDGTVARMAVRHFGSVLAGYYRVIEAP